MAYLIADYVIERLMQQNVEALFGVPAVYGAELFAAAARANTPARTFRTVVNSSDLESGYAADGYARVRGLSAVSVSYGVGTLSLVNAIAGAYIERSPVVVLNGGPSQKNIDDLNSAGVLFSHSMGRPHSDMEAFAPFTALCERAETEARRARPDRSRAENRPHPKTPGVRRSAAGVVEHAMFAADRRAGPRPAGRVRRRRQHNRCFRRSLRRPIR